jgi:hypothetical protein
MTNYEKKNNMIHWKHNTIVCTGYYYAILFLKYTFIKH